MVKHYKDISIQRVISILFIVAILLSTLGVGYLIFTGWISSTQQITENILKEVSNSIDNQINSFLYTPYHINEWNYKLIEDGIIDLNDENARDKYFANTLKTHNDEVYSFSYGTTNGEYYGARRNEEGQIEIMKNNGDTGGNSWYYSVNEDMTAGELAVQAGEFDPRTRDWFKVVAESGKPTFSQIYKHFIMEDLTLSFGWPIYDMEDELQGVLGTHILLSSIGSELKEAIEPYDGYAIIMEKDTGNLVANSMAIDNFTYLEDGTLKRSTICDIGDSNIGLACQHFMESNESQFEFEDQEGNLYVNAREMNVEGLDWLIISAIPQEIYLASVYQREQVFFLLTLLFLGISLFASNKVIKRLLRPMDNLLEASTAFTLGDLSQRVKVARRDEIGRISESFNKVGDKMQFLINNLEDTVEERTQDLQKTNVELEEKKTQLQVILDSTVEGIFGIDLEGKCTFCNKSGVKLLGYKNQEDLLGKHMHKQVHHSYQDGKAFPVDECKILKSINLNKIFIVDDEVFWRADGTYFDVEYYAHPQRRNGKVVGGVITFTDITERKKQHEEIKYLSCHDMLTGLHNKWSFEKNRRNIDVPDNLPISVIYADINGLKLINDIFGHSAGDDLIKKSSEIFTKYCRENDIVARVGGDEFIIILPKTEKENAQKVLSRIKKAFSKVSIMGIKSSISLGADTKVTMDQSLEEVMLNAESGMYKDKARSKRSTNKEIIDTIIENLYIKYPREKQHSIMVSELSARLGRALKLSKGEINKLKRLAYLHHIGKISLNGINSPEKAKEKLHQHPSIGYRILSLFDDTIDLADYVHRHHERWDGKGYPSGLQGEEIPLLSRIILIVETYEHMLNREDVPLAKRKDFAISVIKEGAGKEFDPRLARIFVRMVEDES